jgi:hypothetical protein
MRTNRQIAATRTDQDFGEEKQGGLGMKGNTMRTWVISTALLLLVVMLGCSSKRDLAIAEIERLGGTYRCDEESSDKAIVDVRLTGTQVTDADLEHLKGLTRLHALWLESTRVTDAGLEHLERLSNLRQLYLQNTRVTDAGVEKLKQALPNCEIRNRSAE